jgi:hypothetical protein
MALINKTGITAGGTIQAEHITRAIDALSGVGTDSVIASGSFTGALSGTASFATSASRAVSSSFASSASAISITNTTSGTGPYYVTFVDGVTGTKTLRADSTANALAFNATTNTLTTTSSYAVTASYALNGGGGGESITLAFFHTEVTGTASGSVTYIGGFASAPLGSATRIGLVVPYDGKVTHAWATSFASNPDTCLIDLALMNNGTLVNKIADDLNLDGFTDARYSNDVEYSVSAGDLLNVRIAEKADSGAVWNINAGIVITRV